MTFPRLHTPFVIWTLQRTGGTNFNQFLNQISDRPRLMDEPFNPDRMHGHVTKAWKKSRDEAALRHDIKTILADRPNFKHCVELVPRKLNDILVASTAAHDYDHIFLYRRNQLERILSREYARRTAIWGPKQAQAAKGRDVSSAMASALDADEIILHETKANTCLNRTWTALKAAGVTPTAIAFEDLYATDETEARNSLEQVFVHLGHQLTSDQITQCRRAITTSGNQKTRQKYAQFKGIEQIKQRLDETPTLLCST